MKMLLIVSALAMTSCAPLLSTIQGDDATLTRGGGIVVFAAGNAPAEDVAVYLAGVGLSVTGADCTPLKNGVGCKLKTVQPGTPVNLAVMGTPLSGSATYYRGTSARVYIATLK